MVSAYIYIPEYADSCVRDRGKKYQCIIPRSAHILLDTAIQVIKKDTGKKQAKELLQLPLKVRNRNVKVTARS